jgi:hypothetical protein
MLRSGSLWERVAMVTRKKKNQEVEETAPVAPMKYNKKQQ